MPGTTFTVDSFRYGCVEGCSRIFLLISIVITMVALARNGHMALYIALLSRDSLFKCVSRFLFKEDVLNYVVKITKNHLIIHPRTLVVVGAYSIGKECVYLAISKALGVKIYANASSRRRILQAFGWPDLSDRLCTNGNNTLLHVLPISSSRLETLKDYLKTYKEQFTAILAFRPTGWTFSERIINDLELIKPVSKRNITIYGVPYSEHSSFTELRDFVQECC